jgi:hypothetical protein
MLRNINMLKPKGRYYELPLAGASVRKVVYSGVLQLIFGNLDENQLDLLGRFEVTRYGQATALLPKQAEALLLFYDLLNTGILVREAKADKDGRLFILFSDDTEIAVAEDSQCWQFTRYSSQQPSTNVSVSGSLGYLDF